MQWEDGSTATGVVILDSKLCVFNVGDSQTVLCRGGEAVQLLAPHKPNNECERQRINAANGWISSEIDGDSVVYRVCGDLSVSRAIGDIDYKYRWGNILTSPYIAWPSEHSHTITSDLIVATPDVISMQIEDDFEFLIIASDGLWDFISLTEAVEECRCQLLCGKSVSEAADYLSNLAREKGSGDDITVIVVEFIHEDILLN
jgi:serine/threonine protein phosphatase PrpC